MNPPPDLIQALRGAKRVALATHVNPDGDGLGAEAALAEALQGMGKQVFLVNNDPTPERYRYLGLDRWGRPDGACDLGVVLDTSDKARTGSAVQDLDQAAAVAVVDHHAGGTPFGTCNWIDASAASTGSMVAGILSALEVPLSPGMAGALYTALAFDTGCFRHSNTSREVFLLAAELKAAGADTAEINRLLFDSRPVAAVRLAASSMAALELGDAGLSALSSVSRAMMEQCGAGPEDTDGIVESLRSIQGVEVSALLREEKDCVKLSLRSKRWLDVNRLAGLFGGGGHVRAAGATLKMPLAEAKAAVATRLSEALAAGPPKGVR